MSVKRSSFPWSISERPNDLLLARSPVFSRSLASFCKKRKTWKTEVVSASQKKDAPWILLSGRGSNRRRSQPRSIRQSALIFCERESWERKNRQTAFFLNPVKDPRCVDNDESLCGQRQSWRWSAAAIQQDPDRNEATGKGEVDTHIQNLGIEIKHNKNPFHAVIPILLSRTFFKNSWEESSNSRQYPLSRDFAVKISMPSWKDRYKSLEIGD